MRVKSICLGVQHQLLMIVPAKVGIKSVVDLLENVLHFYMRGCNYPHCLYDQLDS